MSSLPFEVIEMVGQTMAKIVPVTIALAVVCTVLTHFWACNPGKPWWQMRELVTDICYWFFVPVFARIFRIGLMVLGAGIFFNIHDAAGLIAFATTATVRRSFRSGFSALFLVASDFVTPAAPHFPAAPSGYRDPSFFRGSRGFRRAVSPRQPLRQTILVGVIC
jgi:hypothetical protein